MIFFWRFVRRSLCRFACLWLSFAMWTSISDVSLSAPFLASSAVSISDSCWAVEFASFLRCLALLLFLYWFV